jgi:uncharacterized protein with HEPN domain
MEKRIYRNLQDIHEYLTYAVAFGKGADVDTLTKDTMRALSIERALEIAGEAAKQIPENTRQQFPDVPWRTMAGLRDVLAHNYRGVRKEVLLQIINQTAPAALVEIEKILKEHKR